MTEEEARRWLADRIDVPRETFDALDRFVTFLREQAAQQNLIAASTLDAVWHRHIVDSAQLLPLARPNAESWIDLGSGAGFPGLIVAALGRARVTLVEARRKRVEFLQQAALRLGLDDSRVEIIGARVEAVRDRRFDVISARAFAPLERLFPLAIGFADPKKTRWLLPKGRSARAELEAARRSWQGSFRIEPSVTDSEAGILVGVEVRPGKSR